MSRNTSSGSEEYYYSSNPRGDPLDNRREGLPSIHDALGDVLSQPAWPGEDPRTSSRDPAGRGAYRTQDHNAPHHHSPPNTTAGYPRYQRGSSLPPEQSHSRNVHQQSHEGHPVSQQHSDYAFGVYRNTPSGELVEQDESSTRRNREGLPKRYICDECSERFDRPSTLDAHKRKHTGEKPYKCSFPGCGKRFPIKSNMRRHEKSHGAPSAFEPINEDDERDEPVASSSTSYFLPHSAGGSSSQSSQYYSSRRK